MQSIQGPALPCPEPSRYTKLPDALIAELTPREHQLVHALLSFRWFSDSAIFPYVGTLAKMLGCSKRTVQRTLRKLEEKQYLVTVAGYRDISEDGHRGQTSNTYAPGPMLLPLLPPVDASTDAPAERDRRAPMTSPSHRNSYRNNQKGRSRNERRYTPPSTGGYLETRDHGSTDYLATRYGRLRVNT